MNISLFDLTESELLHALRISEHQLAFDDNGPFDEQQSHLFRGDAIEAIENKRQVPDDAPDVYDASVGILIWNIRPLYHQDCVSATAWEELRIVQYPLDDDDAEWHYFIIEEQNCQEAAIDKLTRAVNAVDLHALLEKHTPQYLRPNNKILAGWRGESNPSASLIVGEGRADIINDFGEARGYNAFQYLTEIVGMEPTEARNEIFTAAGMTPDAMTISIPPAVKELLTAKPSHQPDALKGRGFSKQDFLNHMAADGNDLLIPIYSPVGEIIAVKRRFGGEGKQRYSYDFAASEHKAWNSRNVLESRTLVVMEGELNAIKLFVSLNDPEIGVVGMDGVNGSWFSYIARGKQVYVYADGDKPGLEASHRWAEQARQAGASKVSIIPPMEYPTDACDLKKDDLATWFSAATQGLSPTFTALDRVIGDRTLKDLLYDTRRYLSGEIQVSTGFQEIDVYTGGLVPIGVNSIAALSSVGKSMLMRSMLEHMLLKQKRKVMLYTPDQGPDAIYRYLATSISGVPAWRIRRNLWTPYYLDKYGSADGARKHWGEVYQWVVSELTYNFRIYETSSMKEMHKNLEVDLAQGFDTLAVDFIQQFEAMDGSSNPNDGRAAQDLKALTMSNRLCTLMLAQFSKSKYDRKRYFTPMWQDVEGSTRYYQVSDIMFGLYNHELFMKKHYHDQIELPYDYENDTDKARVYVLKNKDGDTGSYRYIQWDRELNTYKDW